MNKCSFIQSRQANKQKSLISCLVGLGALLPETAGLESEQLATGVVQKSRVLRLPFCDITSLEGGLASVSPPVCLCCFPVRLRAPLQRLLLASSASLGPRVAPDTWVILSRSFFFLRNLCSVSEGSQHYHCFWSSPAFFFTVHRMIKKKKRISALERQR